MLWALSALYEWRAGRVGLGMGDVKLVAMLGAYLGLVSSGARSEMERVSRAMTYVDFSSSNLFFDEYCGAFSVADEVYFAPVFHARRVPPEELLDLPGIAAHLRSSGISVVLTESIDELFASLFAGLEEGDVAVTMSSGSFDGLPVRLVTALEERSADRRPASAVHES